MSQFTFVLINEASGPLAAQVTPEWLTKAAASLTVQLNRDFAPHWGGSYLVRAGSGPSDLAKGEIAFALLDTLPSAPGAVAYHDVDGNAVPIAFLALSTCSTLDDVSSAISHECCETGADAGCNLWADDGAGTEWAHEACLAGDTQVKLASGQTVAIEMLADRGGFFEVLACSSSGEIITARGGNARLMRSKAETVTVHFTDGTQFQCTPDHKVLLASGLFILAESLRSGTRLRSDVSPRLTAPSAIDCREIYAQASGADFGWLGTRSQLNDLSSGELRSSGSFASQIPVANHAPLAFSIDHVSEMRADEQMIGAHARGNVARVTHLKPGWDRPPMQPIRNSMRVQNTPARSKLPVAFRVLSTDPQPAPLRGAGDSSPKQVLQGGAASLITRVPGSQASVTMHAGPMRRAQTFGAKRPGTLWDGTDFHAKVVDRVERGCKADVFDCTVPQLGNYALACGVFVHNCDAVESASYRIGDIAVSDFVTPAFFVRNSAGPYSFMGVAYAPFQTAGGGYQIKRTSGTGESQVTGDLGSKRGMRAVRGEHHWSSRTARRGVPRITI